MSHVTHMNQSHIYTSVNMIIILMYFDHVHTGAANAATVRVTCCVPCPLSLVLAQVRGLAWLLACSMEHRSHSLAMCCQHPAPFCGVRMTRRYQASFSCSPLSPPGVVAQHRQLLLIRVCTMERPILPQCAMREGVCCFVLLV